MTIAAVLVATLIAMGTFLALATFAFRKRRREGKQEEPNYRTFFVIGLVWFVTGLALLIAWALLDIALFLCIPFLGMGLAYLAIGWANRDKWQTNR